MILYIVRMLRGKLTNVKNLQTLESYILPTFKHSATKFVILLISLRSFSCGDLFIFLQSLGSVMCTFGSYIISSDVFLDRPLLQGRW